VVLVAVFVPLAFFGGSVGNIYRQFAAVMVASILFSAFMALSLTPALCASLLQQVEAGHHLTKRGPFGLFNRFFQRTADNYGRRVDSVLPRAFRMLVIYGLIAAVVGFVYLRLPTSFLPAEDQGNMLVNVQLPPGATLERTQAVMEQVEGFMLKQPEVQSMVAVLGFSFSGQGQNAALSFITLKDWSERKRPEQSAQALAGRAFGALMGIRDAFIFPLSPPPIPELGAASGFNFRLQDRAGLGHDALVAARNQLLGLTRQSKLLSQVRPDGLEDAPQLLVDVDREKAAALGVGFDSISATLSTALGSAYVNDFPNAGRLQRVVVQADAPARMQPEDLLRLNASNATRQAGAAFGLCHHALGHGRDADRSATTATRRCASAAAPRPASAPAPRWPRWNAWPRSCRKAFGYEWTGISREEKLAGSQALVLYGFAILAVFLCLAALVRKLDHSHGGDHGGAAGRAGRGAGHAVARLCQRRVLPGRPDHHHRPVGEERDPDHRVRQGPAGPGQERDRSGAEAAHLRFRPIVMTSMAFILGVMPLALASGAGSASQRAIGTGVIGGMITAVFLSVIFVPVFFVVMRRLFKPSERQMRMYRHESENLNLHVPTEDR
jgi:multidrug efflux pump